MKGEKIMGSTGGNGRPLARASARSATGLRPMTREERAQFRASTGRNAPRGAMTSDFLQRGTQARQSASTPVRSRGAGTGAVSREELRRATGRGRRRR